VLLVGCNTSKQYTPPTKAVLQGPLPDKALLHLFRAPYDEQDLEFSLNSGKKILLPANKYTAISIEPGSYTLATIIKGAKPDQTENQIPWITFTVGTNQRLGYLLSAPE